MAFHESIFKLAFVSRHIWPNHDSSAMHVILDKVSFIYLAGIRKVVFTLAMELAIDEVSLVVRAIKLEPSFTSFLAI